MYKSKPTATKPSPPRIMPTMPLIVLRPIMPNKSAKRNITKKNQREFHHATFGAEKQTTNHDSPAMDNMMLDRPNVRLFFTKTKSFTIGLCL
jgi:hypothetical protein